MVLDARELPSESTGETERHRLRAGVHIGGEGDAVLLTRKTSGEPCGGGFFGRENKWDFTVHAMSRTDENAGGALKGVPQLLVSLEEDMTPACWMNGAWVDACDDSGAVSYVLR